MQQIEQNEVVNENDRKKEYLRGYGKHRRKIKRIEAELDEIRLMKMYPSSNNDGMPKGSGKSDLSGYAVELDELENAKYSEGVEQVKAYKEILWRIKQLPNENERDVLFYRYIKVMEFWDIAAAMGFSERQIYRLHGKALAHFKLKK